MVDAREMKKILRNNGYEYQRCKGSHFMYSMVFIRLQLIKT